MARCMTGCRYDLHGHRTQIYGLFPVKETRGSSWSEMELLLEKIPPVISGTIIYPVVIYEDLNVGKWRRIRLR